MESLKFSAAGYNFYVLFMDGFTESRGQMAQETGGDEAYCLKFLENLSGSSPSHRDLDMSKEELKSEVCYDFTFPNRWEKEGANLRLLAAWSYWMDGVITDSAITEMKQKLAAIAGAD